MLISGGRAELELAKQMKVLVIDIGGTHVKVLATGQKQQREFVSGHKLTPKWRVPKVRKLAADWLANTTRKSRSSGK